MNDIDIKIDKSVVYEKWSIRMFENSCKDNLFLAFFYDKRWFLSLESCFIFIDLQVDPAQNIAYAGAAAPECSLDLLGRLPKLSSHTCIDNWYSDGCHDFFVIIPRHHKYASTFFPRIFKFWKCFPVECFLLFYY